MNLGQDTYLLPHSAKGPELDLGLNTDPKHCEQLQYLVTLYLECAVDIYYLTAVIVRRWMACLRCCMMWNYTRPRKKARTPARPHTAVHYFQRVQTGIVSFWT
jgi:hypothetical protein